MMRTRWIARAALLGALALSLSCGGSKEGAPPQTAAGMTADAIDADPIALLPPNPVTLANVDARAFFTSDSLGPQLARLGDQVIPIGQDAGFVASRDVDRVVVGSYTTQGADVVAVVVGRFDPDKIASASEAKAKAGGGFVASDYAGRRVFTANNVGFTVLTSKTVLVGTETAMHRALDRVHDGAPKREVTPWMLDTIQTPNAAAAVAADFATQPIAATSLGALPLPWLRGLKAVRVLADFKPPGMHVAGTLTYAEAAQAQKGADGLRAVQRLVAMAAITGAVPKIQDFTLDPKDADLQCSFALDDGGLRKIGAILPQLVQR